MSHTWKEGLNNSDEGDGLLNEDDSMCEIRENLSFSFFYFCLLCILFLSMKFWILKAAQKNKARAM